MRSRTAEERDPIVLAEKILALLDEGRFTATYKYAVLLALIDLCLENTSRTGQAPEMVTTRQLAAKIVDIYWPHSAPYHGIVEPRVLRQSRGGRDSQAAIVHAITRFREQSARDPSAPLSRARLASPDAFDVLVRTVEWKLVQMPLPRLQTLGHGHDPFLYSIAWDESIRKGDVGRYQRGLPSPFDNRVHLAPGVGEDLVLLNGLLRPLIHREWAVLVAKMNQLEESRLEEFLFGSRRIALEPVRPGLQELQDNRCFYCDDRLRGTAGERPQVDHFVPWARYPNDAIENLVVAHERCNREKRDFLAASDHVTRWRGRLEDGGLTAASLLEIARRASWEADAGRSLRVARGIYLHLPASVPLWLRGKEFVALEPERMVALLA